MRTGHPGCNEKAIRARVASSILADVPSNTGSELGEGLGVGTRVGVALGEGVGGLTAGRVALGEDRASFCAAPHPAAARPRVRARRRKGLRAIRMLTYSPVRETPGRPGRHSRVTVLRRLRASSSDLVRCSSGLAREPSSTSIGCRWTARLCTPLPRTCVPQPTSDSCGEARAPAHHEGLETPLSCRDPFDIVERSPSFGAGQRFVEVDDVVPPDRRAGPAL